MVYHKTTEYSVDTGEIIEEISYYDLERTKSWYIINQAMFVVTNDQMLTFQWNVDSSKLASFNIWRKCSNPEAKMLQIYCI